jgi:hypothetical protein
MTPRYTSVGRQKQKLNQKIAAAAAGAAAALSLKESTDNMIFGCAYIIYNSAQGRQIWSLN